MDWVLEPAAGDVDARRALAEWTLAISLEDGVVLLADDRRALGALLAPLEPERSDKRAREYMRGTGLVTTSVHVGSSLYPHVPLACQRRLYSYGQQYDLIRPRRPALVLSPGSEFDDLWVAMAREGFERRRDLVVVCLEDEAPPPNAGFVRGRAVPGRRTRPALATWHLDMVASD